MSRRQRFSRGLTYLFLSVSSFIMIYPVLYMALGAFTTEKRFYQFWFVPIPNNFDWMRVVRTWQWAAEAYAVTLLRVGFYIGMTLFVGVVAGYIFSKMRFPGRERLFLLLLSGLVMPAILMIVPQYILAARWPLVGGNDLWGQGGHGFAGEWPVLFLYGWVPPFAIFLFKQTFDMLPNDYEEAAKLDGAGMFSIIFRVYGPMLKPALAALIIITFLAIWNDYLWPSLTIAGKPEWYPVSFKVGQDVGYAEGTSPDAFLRLFMVMWPPAAAYFLLQRSFVQGLVSSGLKG